MSTCGGKVSPGAESGTLLAVGARSFAIGDIHGDVAALNRLLAKLPPLEATDTVIFLGDYVDRGPDSKQTVEAVRAFCARTAARTVTLRGNHEDKWVQSYTRPDLPFMLQ